MSILPVLPAASLIREELPRDRRPRPQWGVFPSIGEEDAALATDPDGYALEIHEHGEIGNTPLGWIPLQTEPLSLRSCSTCIAPSCLPCPVWQG